MNDTVAKNLMLASREWQRRPAPDRYYDVADVIPRLQRAEKYRRSILVPQDQIKMVTRDNDFYLQFPGPSVPVRLNNWSFDQLCDKLDVSSADIRAKKYPAHVVLPMLEYRLATTGGEDKSNNVDELPDESDDPAMLAMLGETAIVRPDSMSRQLNIVYEPNHEGLVASSIYSATYGMYPDLKLANDAMLAVEAGWRTPRAMAIGNNPFNDVSVYGANHIQADRIATIDDEMKCSLIKAGMRMGPAGVYHADRNTFIFLVSDKEVLPGHFRFVIMENSEKGESRKLKATFGLMNYVCMNHILWGCTNVHSIEKKHRRGSVGEFHGEFAQSLELVTKSEGVNPALYSLAKTKALGATKEAVLDAAYKFGRSKTVSCARALTQRACERAWECAESNPGDADGAAPNTYWGFVQGMTRYAQSIPHADLRTDMDRAAGMFLDSLEIEEAPVSESVPATIADDGTVETPKGKRGKTK